MKVVAAAVILDSSSVRSSLVISLESVLCLWLLILGTLRLTHRFGCCDLVHHAARVLSFKLEDPVWDVAIWGFFALTVFVLTLSGKSDRFWPLEEQLFLGERGRE